MIDKIYIEDEIIAECTHVLGTIKELFVDFFGEDKVDSNVTASTELVGYKVDDILDASNHPELETDSSIINRLKHSRDIIAGEILIYYPEITVTNERSKSHKITDVYVKVMVNVNGTIMGGFKVNRASYTSIEYESHYMHSHCPRRADDPSYFSSFCLGNGPIVSTIASITSKFDENLWRLFIVEMDGCLKTESLSGGPYIKMTDIGRHNGCRLLEDFDFSIANYPGGNPCIFADYTVNEFLDYLFTKNILKFTFSEGVYGYTESMSTLCRVVGRLYFEWLRDNYREAFESLLYDSTIVRTYKYTSLGTYIFFSTRNIIDTISEESASTVVLHPETPVCTFKGDDIYLTITRVSRNENNAEIENSIAYPIVISILTSILNYLNLNYGK